MNQEQTTDDDDDDDDDDALDIDGRLTFAIFVYLCILE